MGANMQLEDLGYIYKYLGSFPLENLSIDHHRSYAYAKLLALSNKYGILCCGLSSGKGF